MDARTKLAFTVVELLIVVAIVAALAAIILPVLAHARRKADQSTCISQLAQIGKACQMYIEDYSARPPHIHDLYPQFVSDRRIFVCQRDQWIQKGGWAWSAWGRYSTPPERWPFPVSYGYFFGPHPEDQQWEKVQAAPGRPGYVICVLHGESTGRSLAPGEAPYFQGTVLRLSFDGSVISRDIRSRFNIWKLMTDQDHQPGGP